MTATQSLAAMAGDIKLGDKTVHRLGLGTNRITDIPEAHALLTHATELGVNFIDTARLYSAGNSETTIGNTLAPYHNHAGLVIATKGGFTDGSPGNLRNELETSLRALKTDCIDLYQLHRVDPRIPIEESIDAMKTFQREGKINHIGLSEVTIEQLQAAQTVATIVSVQNEYNFLQRQHETLLEYCTEQHIVFIPWSPLGGLGSNAEKVMARLRGMAKQYNATPHQLALAWLLRRSPVMLPIPGTLSLEHLETNLAAARIQLSPTDYEQLTAI